MITYEGMDAETLKLQTMKNADPLLHNKLMCEKIKKDISKTYLPLFTPQETEHIKKHLENYHRIPNNELAYDFLNLRNIFLTIKQFEEEPIIITKINTILGYLKKFDYIFLKIIETQNTKKKNNPLLDRALIILHLDINIFCMRYQKLLKDHEPEPDTTPLTTNQDNEEPEPTIPEDEEQTTLTTYPETINEEEEPPWDSEEQ